MRKIIYLLPLFLMILVFRPVQTFAQSKAEVQNIAFDAANDTMVVTYDLLKAKSSEKFKVVLQVKTVTGKSFDIISVRGDVGDNVSGGKGKRIVWDLTKDKAYINNEDIFVNVLVTPVVTTAGGGTVQPPPESTPKETKPPKQKTEKIYSKGAAIALSAIFPGVGINKLRGGGAYWLMGLATWGCFIGGVSLGISSSSTFKKYQDATTSSDRDDLFQKATNQRKTANILLYTAAGIWALDMILTIAIPAKPKYKFSMGATYDPVINRPLLTFSYRLGK